MKKLLFILASALLVGGSAVSCTESPDKDPNYMPPEILFDEEEEYPEDLPKPGPMTPYEESTVDRPYRPITVKYSSSVPPTWQKSNTRLLAYMYKYKMQVNTYDEYKAITNQWGSYTGGASYAATGRFYVKKVGDRWWIIDPEGYPYYMRGVASFRKGESTRNRTGWNARFTSDENWVATSQNELAQIGVHQTGAFCTDTYTTLQDHNKVDPQHPLPLAPSFGFLAQFRTQCKHAYADGSSANVAGLVFYDDWGTFCEDYLRSAAFSQYVGDKYTFGFFSDNEIDFSSLNSMLLKRFIDIKDKTNVAYLAAKKFMDDKGATVVTDALNSEFSGMVAEIYYKGVREAIDKVDPEMLYLGTRLHGTPKYIEGIIRAAGKYCDIISINYYSRWSPEGKTVIPQWAMWADKPFVVTEFYTKGYEDSDLNNKSGAGFCVPTQADRAYAYQHFTLGLLEAKNCVGWYWFKYQDDDYTASVTEPANKGIYDNNYQMFPYLVKLMSQINFNTYNIIDYFDKQQ